MNIDIQETPTEKAKQETFLIRDYELKIRYLCDHYERMWTRFNYFVTIEAAIIGGKLLFGNDGKENFFLLALLGAGVSFIWYVMGAQDRFVARVHQKQVVEASKKVASSIWADKADQERYCYVGEIEKTVLMANKNEGSENRLDPGLSGWRLKPISTTRLAALIPLFFLLIWVGILISIVIFPMVIFPHGGNATIPK
jgi:hypothetical protein